MRAIATRYEPVLIVRGLILSSEDLGYVNDRVMGELCPEVSSYPYTLFLRDGVGRRLSPSLDKAMKTWKEQSDKIGRALWIVAGQDWLTAIAGECGLGVLIPVGSHESKIVRLDGEKLDLELPEPREPQRQLVRNGHTAQVPFLRLRGGISSVAEAEDALGHFVRRFLSDKTTPEDAVLRERRILRVSFEDVAVHPEAYGLLKDLLASLDGLACRKGWRLEVIASPDVTAVAVEARLAALAIASVPKPKPHAHLSQPQLLGEEPEPVTQAGDTQPGPVEERFRKQGARWTTVQEPPRP